MKTDKNISSGLRNPNLVRKGKLIYKKIKSKLESKFKGKILAIEVDSGEYVIGDDELHVALEAMKKFPDKIFYFIRIGFSAVHKLRNR